VKYLTGMKYPIGYVTKRVCQFPFFFIDVPALQSLADVKTRIMDTTLYNLAYLSHYLGYAWPFGCRSNIIGEDFKRNGDSWEAVFTTRSYHCHGYMSRKRLKIHYSDFRFSIVDIKFSKPVIDSMAPTVVDSGKFTNAHDTPKKVKITRDLSFSRTVTHTKTSSWKNSRELGIELSYNPPPGGFGAKASYKFNYENGETETDAEADQQTSTFSVVAETVNLIRYLIGTCRWTFQTLTLFKTPKFSKPVPYIRHYVILLTLFKTERKITYSI